MVNETIIDKIKAYFESGGKLTVLKALILFGTTELRSAVSKLKKRGMNLVSHQVKGERFFEYWLAS